MLFLVFDLHVSMLLFLNKDHVFLSEDYDSENVAFGKVFIRLGYL